jgi:hypothetical protein
MIRFRQEKGWWSWSAALILLIFSLLIYESHLGLTAAGSVALFVFSKNQTLPRRIALLAPALIAIFSAVWRLTFQVAGGPWEYTSQPLACSIQSLMSRVIAGYKINLLKSWIVGLREVFPHWQLPPWLSSAVTPVLSISAIALLILIITLKLKRGHLKDSGLDEANPASLPVFRQQIVLGLSGLLVLGAAYMPAMVAVEPSLGFIGSRINALPSIGAAVFLGTLLAMIATLPPPKVRRTTLLFILLSTPFIFIGGAAEIGAQQKVEKGWREQKRIWQQMFDIAPALIKGTNVILILSEDKSAAGVGPFQDGMWGFSSALSLLYGHDELKGFFLYEGTRRSLEYREEGIVPSSHKSYPVFPYRQTLLFRYDRGNGDLKLIEELLPDKTGLSQPITDLGAGCILAQSERQNHLRRLVE